MLRISTDPEADAIYIQLRALPVSYTKELDDNRYIDYAEDGTPVGIDLLGVSEGVDLADLPETATFVRVLEELKLKVFA